MRKISTSRKSTRKGVVLGLSAFEKISAVEGIRLSRELRDDLKSLDAKQDKELRQYSDKWNLSQAEPLSETFTSKLYKVHISDQVVVLKILSDAGIEDEGAASDALKWFDGLGAVRLLRHDAGAMLLEYVDGNDLTELVKAGRDDEATHTIASVLNKLHAPKGTEFPAKLIPLTQRFKSLFEAAKHEMPILLKGGAVARSLLANQGPQYVLHGDIHHENIKHHQSRGWLAIDPKGLIGERVYDAANALCNPHSLPEIAQNRDRLLRQARIMAATLGTDPNRLLSYVFAHACLSASWFIEDGLDAHPALAMAEIAETCIPSMTI